MDTRTLLTFLALIGCSSTTQSGHKPYDKPDGGDTGGAPSVSNCDPGCVTVCQVEMGCDCVCNAETGGSG